MNVTNTKRILRYLLLVVLLVVPPIRGFTQTTFISLPLYRSFHTRISPDGRWVVGDTGAGASIWGESTGLKTFSFSTPAMGAAGVSGDGQVIAVEAWFPPPQGWSIEVHKPALIRGGFLNLLPEPFDYPTNYGIWGMSNDGRVVIGNASEAIHSYDYYGELPVKWVDQEPFMLPMPSGFIVSRSEAYDVSYDGRVVVGHCFREGPYGELGTYGLVWADDGLSVIPSAPFAAPLNPDSVALSVSGDGRVVGGTSNGQCIRWTKESGLEVLGGMDTSGPCDVRALNEDGSILAGSSNGIAFIWDRDHGFRNLRDLLVNEYGLQYQLAYTSLTKVFDMSADGTTLIGEQAGSPYLWYAKLRRWDVVDPVPDLLHGPMVTNSTENLATGGRPVAGVSADGISQVVVRLFLPSTETGAEVTVLDEDGVPSGSAEEDGALAEPGVDAFQSATSVLSLHVRPTSKGPAVFVVYRSPVDFARPSQAGNDGPLSERTVFLQFRFSNGNEERVPIKIVRPPVLLLHGIFSDPMVWDAAPLLINDRRFLIDRLDYHQDIDNEVAATVPDVTSYRGPGRPIRRNVVGVGHNAPFLLKQVSPILERLRLGNRTPTRLPVAATQVDLVGHSLGGLMARGMARLPDSFLETNFFRGLFHKLITIGTPHLGSHHALHLMDGTSDCTRDKGALVAAYNLRTLTINGRVVSGGVFDLVGDGTEANLSAALRELRSPLPTLGNGRQVPKLPTAMIGGRMGTNNRSETVDWWGIQLRRTCSDFLAQHYSNDAWPGIFNFEPSDAIVPETSASSRQPMFTLFQGVVHGPGSVGVGTLTDPHLGFNGPCLLDDASGAPGRVLELLNTFIKSQEFVLLPQ